MSDKLVVTTKEKYTELVMQNGARASDFLNFYAEHFRTHAGCEKVYMLVDVRGRLAILGLAEFRAILDLMHENQIMMMDMHVVTNDDARPMIGEMIKALCEESISKINTFFYRDKDEVEHILARL
ncbi:MAG: hypothetical protein ACNI26_13460 [Terasakiella sp.]|uniref:hypothetical protein n=1 Tax=unclassified Terasakiella TaxID=2614952 RepID=UPI003B00E3EE